MMKTLIFGHRGARAYAPENTLPAFLLAHKMGANGIELDIQLSADNEVVVFHDSQLSRTTSGSGLLKDHNLSELKKLDAGSWFSEEFAGTEIPTLSEVLTSIPQEMKVNIELKAFNIINRARNRVLVDKAVAVVEEYLVTERVIFSSFNPFLLGYLKRTYPHITAGYLYAPEVPLPLKWQWFANAVIGKHEAKHPHFSMVNERYLSWSKKQGYSINTWTVNEPEDIRRMVDLGVDIVISDYPDRIRDIIKRKV